jgi:hypothetical protein
MLYHDYSGYANASQCYVHTNVTCLRIHWVVMCKDKLIKILVYGLYPTRLIYWEELVFYARSTGKSYYFSIIYIYFILMS